MNNKYQLVSNVIKEFGNCAAGLTAYESPARPFKNSENIKKNWDKMIKGKKIKKWNLFLLYQN